MVVSGTAETVCQRHCSQKIGEVHPHMGCLHALGHLHGNFNSNQLFLPSNPKTYSCQVEQSTAATVVACCAPSLLLAARTSNSDACSLYFMAPDDITASQRVTKAGHLRDATCSFWILLGLSPGIARFAGQAAGLDGFPQNLFALRLAICVSRLKAALRATIVPDSLAFAPANAQVQRLHVLLEQRRDSA